jgi:hypothetical protein
MGNINGLAAGSYNFAEIQGIFIFYLLAITGDVRIRYPQGENAP